MVSSPNVVPFPAMPDRAADERFEQLVDQYATILRSHLTEQCPRSAGVAVGDVEQDAIMRLMRTLRADTHADVYRHGVTIALDAVKRAIARRDEKSANTTSDSRARLLLEAVSQLPDPERRCIALHLQGLPADDIATLLGCSQARVRKLVGRASETLRNTLQQPA